MEYRKARQEWTGKDGGLKGLRSKAAREGKGRGHKEKKCVRGSSLGTEALVGSPITV